MKEICAVADMSPGAVYRYFSSKDDIIRAIIEHEQKRAEVALYQLWQENDIKGALLKFVEETVREACRPRDNILGTEIFAEAGRNKAVENILRQSETDLMDTLEKLLTHAIETSHLTLALSPRDTAQTIVALSYGLSGSALLNKKMTGKRAASLARDIMERLIQ